MLDELKNLKYHGGKDGLLFFIRDVVGSRKISIRDAEIMCAHAPVNSYLAADDLISFCLALGWIQINSSIISISPSLSINMAEKDSLNNALIQSTVEQLFSENILNSSMFSYDTAQCRYLFRNELLPLSLSNVRNVLISQGFFIPVRTCQTTHFFINPLYDDWVAKYCKSKRTQLSLEKLKIQLEANELAGEKAELFVLEFEKKRLGTSFNDNIKRISEIDTSAGYDIVSFNSPCSKEADRFIEVKAISQRGFYWSKNEYEMAKLKGDLYYLYLVELTKINKPDYIPRIIQNPASKIMSLDEWFVEAQSYHVKHV